MSTDLSSAITGETIPVTAGFELSTGQPNMMESWFRLFFVTGKTAKSILISCGARLAPFDIQELREIMSYDEM